MSSLRSSRWAAGGGENKKPTSDNSNLKSYLRNFDFNLKSTISSGSSPTFGASTPLNPRVNALESPSLPKALEQKGTIVQASPTPEDAFARKRAESFKDKIHAAAASALGRNTSGSPGKLPVWSEIPVSRITAILQAVNPANAFNVSI